jgi:hypothetical protein
LTVHGFRKAAVAALSIKTEFVAAVLAAKTAKYPRFEKTNQADLKYQRAALCVPG